MGCFDKQVLSVNYFKSAIFFSSSTTLYHMFKVKKAQDEQNYGFEILVRPFKYHQPVLPSGQNLRLFLQKKKKGAEGELETPFTQKYLQLIQ